MKKFLAFLMICFISFIVYYDITTGTLPQNVTIPYKEPSLPANQPLSKSDLNYYEVTIKPGDTLLSIIEREEGSLTQPIETIVTDFQELNEGLKPEQMQIGKTYKIPSYKKMP